MDFNRLDGGVVSVESCFFPRFLIGISLRVYKALAGVTAESCPSRGVAKFAFLLMMNKRVGG